jgi:hypothetical protein
VTALVTVTLVLVVDPFKAAARDMVDGEMVTKPELAPVTVAVTEMDEEEPSDPVRVTVPE